MSTTITSEITVGIPTFTRSVRRRNARIFDSLGWPIVAGWLTASVGCTTSGTPARDVPGTPGQRARLELLVPDEIVSASLDPLLEKRIGAGNYTDEDLKAYRDFSGRARKRPFEMILTNESDQPLWVNTRMKDVPSQASLPIGRYEVVITLVGPSGPVATDCTMSPPQQNKPEYAILRPGESVRRKSALWCYPPFEEPAIYTVQAIYRDQSPGPPPAPAGATQLAEAIVSEPVRFRVLPR